MLQSNRIKEINSTGIFNSTEVEKGDNEENPNTFKSICFYLIFHFTNEELYYMSDEELRSFENSDEEHDTDKGRVYCFN